MSGPSSLVAALSAARDETIACSDLLYSKGEEQSESRGHLARRREVVELYDRLRPSLYQYLICLGLKPHDSDDVIQETFLRLFRFQDSGGTVSNPRSWIFRVAHNLSLDIQKAGHRLISYTNEDETQLAIARRNPGLNPEEVFLQKEQLARLDAALDQLSVRQRHFVHLRAEGLRYREIAEVLGTTVSTVNEGLRRAIVRIMETLYE
jgi:RNA polymerase sigma-70 factor (ECF subfamily)